MIFRTVDIQKWTIKTHFLGGEKRDILKNTKAAMPVLPVQRPELSQATARATRTWDEGRLGKEVTAGILRNESGPENT